MTHSLFSSSPVLWFVVLIVFIIGAWKVFEKAGEPGWAVLIPFYNMYLGVKIAGRPGWWFLLFFIPIVNVIVGIVLGIDLAARFGKGVEFAIGLILLPFIFYPILGFGDATYSPK